jgi:hypothetical protein
VLRAILAMLASGRPLTPGAIALELGVGAVELEDMLARLCALGYVEELSSELASACGDGSPELCAGCKGCASCFPAPAMRLWRLGEKGRRAFETGPEGSSDYRE